MMDALQPFPEARIAVANHLMAVAGDAALAAPAADAGPTQSPAESQSRSQSQSTRAPDCS